MKTKSLIFLGLIIALICLVGSVAGATQTLTVVYYSDQTSAKFSDTITVSGTTYTGITVTDGNGNYYRFFPKLEEVDPTQSRIPVFPSGGTWTVVQQYDYAKNTAGNTYVNTGVPTSSDLTVDVNVNFESLTGAVSNPGALFGARSTGTPISKAITVWVNNDGLGHLGWNYGSNDRGTRTTASVTTNNDYTIKVTGGKLYVDTTLVDTTTGTWSAGSNIYLFAFNHNGQTTYIFNGVAKISSFKIYTSSSTLVDGIFVNVNNEIKNILLS